MPPKGTTSVRLTLFLNVPSLNGNIAKVTLAVFVLYAATVNSYLKPCYYWVNLEARRPLDVCAGPFSVERDVRVYSVGRASVQPPPPTRLSPSPGCSREAGLKSALTRALETKLALLRFFYLHLYTRFVHMLRPFLCRPFTCVEFFDLGFLWYVCCGSIFIPNNILLGISVPQSLPLVERTAGFVGLFWIVCLPPSLRTLSHRLRSRDAETLFSHKNV